MLKVDINEFSLTQMEATYVTESKIKKTERNIGSIGDRYQCNIKDIGMTKKYDLIYGHWCLGYLFDKDLFEFLKQCRVSLLRSD